MLAVETPQPAVKKQSLLRRFSRKDREDASADFNTMFAPLPQSTRKLHRRRSPQAPLVPGGLPTPPASPRNSAENEVKIDIAQPRLLPMIVHRVELPHFESKPEVTIAATPRLQAETPPPSPPPLIRLRVLPDAMPALQFSPHPQIRPWDVFLPPSQVFSLYLGYLPKEWTDQWFVYSEGPDAAGKLKVHFHRSWTGEKIAQLFIVMDVKGEGAGKIVGIKWTGGSEANYMNEKDAKYMIRTTCKGTLGVALEDSG